MSYYLSRKPNKFISKPKNVEEDVDYLKNIVSKIYTILKSVNSVAEIKDNELLAKIENLYIVLNRKK